ncbi:MAG: hypothetical protein WCQ95_14440 [Bacteroidota bacterium]
MILDHPFSKTEKRILYVLFVCTWVFVWLKAIAVPFMHDEVATFFYFIQNHRFIPFLSGWDANNHFLNSALTSLFYSLFGDAPLWLRMPNVLMFPLYFYYCVRLSSFLQQKLSRWVFILALTLSTAMVDFFCISRGYGMSMAFLAAALFWFFKCLQQNQLKHHFYCLLFGLLALSANLTLLVSFSAIIGLLMLHNLVHIKQGIAKNLKQFLLYLLVGIAPLLFAVFYMFALKQHGALYYGSLLGFWKLTVFSISTMLSGMSNWVFPYIFMILFLVQIVIAGFLLIKNSKLNIIFQPYLTFFLLLCGNIAVILFLGKVMKVNYPEDRVGLYLFPYFIGSLVFLTDRLFAVINKKWLFVVLIPCLFFPVNFMYSLNLSHYNIYPEDRFPQRFFQNVCLHTPPNPFPATIGGNSVKHFCWTFFNYRSGGTQSAMQYWNFPSTDEEYQIVKPDEIGNWRQYYDSLDYDRNTKLLLLKRKHFYEKVLLKTLPVNSKTNIRSEYFNIDEFKTDSLVGKTLYLGYKLNFATPAVPFNTRLVIDVSDKDSKNIAYQYISLNWLKLYYKGDNNNFVNGMLVHKLPPEASSIKTYVWNIDTVPYAVSGTFFVYELKEK